MRQDPGAERPLPAHGAFVVQFGTETDVARGQFVGRVEHVVSGRATHFLTLEACVAFVGRVLADVRRQPSEDMSSREEALQTGSDRRHPCGRRAVE